MNRLVIGIGNEYRRDDGVGIVVADDISKQEIPGVRVVTATGEPGTILDAWTGAVRAVIVDAAMFEGSVPGRIRRWTPGDVEAETVLSSHALGLPQTYALGKALDQIPEQLVVFTVDIADAGHGIGLTRAVAAAVPQVVAAILDELNR